MLTSNEMSSILLSSSGRFLTAHQEKEVISVAVFYEAASCFHGKDSRRFASRTGDLGQP